jgi:EAL domain-containing protein (putative c-di-GMP-specific phosphodiesterase class I)
MLNPGKIPQMQASASLTVTGDSKAAIGEALKQALSGNRLQSISLHDERGDVLWLDEGALGPDEHNLVVEAAAALAAGTDRSYVFQSIGDGRAAAFLPARSPLNELIGLAMIIADAKFLDSKGAAKFVTPTTTNLMRRLAFLRRPPAPAPAVPAAPLAPAVSAKVVSPPAQPAAAPARPAAPAAGPRPGAAAAPPRPAAPAAPVAQRPAAPAAPAARPPTPPSAARPAAPAARPAAPPPKAAQPAPARPVAPPSRPAAPAEKPTAAQPPQRPATIADTDSIAFEISDIDPKSLLKGASKPAAPETKRPDLRVVQSGSLPKLELSLEADPIPELIADDTPIEIPEEMTVDGPVEQFEEASSEEVTTEVEALAVAESNMDVEPQFVEEAAQTSVGPGQFEFYGQIFELHVQQLVKLRAGGGTRRFEVLVRDAHADNEFGVAPERVMQDVHDPSANSDLDRIVVEQLVGWLGENRAVWDADPSSFSVNIGMGTIADPKFATFVAGVLKNHKVPAKAIGFEITEKSCVEQMRDVDMFVQACEKIGCHVVLDDFTFHHNSVRWLGSGALKFLKLDAKITAIAMKERVPQALVVAICQASKVLGLSCVAKRVDTPAVREWLAAVGIDYAQGFLLDQPKPLISLTSAPAK